MTQKEKDELRELLDKYLEELKEIEEDAWAVIAAVEQVIEEL